MCSTTGTANLRILSEARLQRHMRFEAPQVPPSYNGFFFTALCKNTVEEALENLLNDVDKTTQPSYADFLDHLNRNPHLLECHDFIRIDNHIACLTFQDECLNSKFRCGMFMYWYGYASVYMLVPKKSHIEGKGPPFLYFFVQERRVRPSLTKYLVNPIKNILAPRLFGPGRSIERQDRKENWYTAKFDPSTKKYTVKTLSMFQYPKVEDLLAYMGC